jgi:hypothetical protein
MVYSTCLQKFTCFSAELQAKASLCVMQCVINNHPFLSLILDATPVNFLNITFAPSEANDMSLFVNPLKKKNLLVYKITIIKLNKIIH